LTADRVEDADEADISVFDNATVTSLNNAHSDQEDALSSHHDHDGGSNTFHQPNLSAAIADDEM